MPDINNKEYYIERAAKDLADDIDFEVMTQVLLESGWTKVVLRPMTWERGAAIDQWVDANFKNGFLNRGLVWLFKSSKDATMFTLKWYE